MAIDAMRVSHVITRLIVGGAQENTVATVLGLQKFSDVETVLISGPTTGPEGSLVPLFATSPKLLKIVPSLIRPIRPWTDWLALRELTVLFRASRPDIVHTHSGKAGILGRLAAHRAGTPVIIHTIHGPSFGNFQGPAANIFFQIAERWAGVITTHFVTVADAMTKQYLAAGIGNAEKYTRILSGFDLGPFLAAENSLELRTRYGLAAEHFVIGKIARLTERKGHADLFAVAPRLIQSNPLVRFLLVGDGPWRQRFEEEIKRLGIERQVIFAGLVSPEEVPALLGISDIVVHLSTREGLPRALPQALAAGRPVVAYDCDGASEVCVDEKTGFLIAPGDQARLAEKILLLSRDRALRERLAGNGRRMVTNLFPVEKMVQGIYELYQALQREARPANAS